MSGLNLRIEGFAKEQLSQGKGTMSIVHELVRMGRIDKGAAQSIVDHARPELIRQAPRRGRGALLFGLAILAIPVSIVGTYIYDAFILSYGGRFQPAFNNALLLFLAPPMLLPEIIGIALVAYGWSLMKRSKGSIDPIAPRGPVRTGLWWRADPFEWK